MIRQIRYITMPGKTQNFKSIKEHNHECVVGDLGETPQGILRSSKVRLNGTANAIAGVVHQ